MKKKLNSSSILITVHYGFLSSYILISTVEKKKENSYSNCTSTSIIFFESGENGEQKANNFFSFLEECEKFQKN